MSGESTTESMTPDVSIVVPTLNEERNIGRLLASLRRQRGVTAEIIVVDQHSDDRTPEIARSFGASVVSIGRSPFYRPPSASRNIGAAMATAPVLAHLDADMELDDPDLLRKALKLIAPSSQAVVLHEQDVPAGFWNRVKAMERSCYVGSEIEAARLVTQKLFKEVGGYNVEISSGEDFDIHSRYRACTEPVSCEYGSIRHYTGRTSLRSLLRKKHSYGRAASVYLAQNERITPAQLLAIQATAFWRNRSLITRSPILYCGVWLLRTMEAVALLSGLIRSKL